MAEDPPETQNYNFPLMSGADSDYVDLWHLILEDGAGDETNNDGLIVPLDSILARIDDETDQNASDISTNASDISTNASNISAVDDDLSSHKSATSVHGANGDVAGTNDLYTDSEARTAVEGSVDVEALVTSGASGTAPVSQGDGTLAMESVTVPDSTQENSYSGGWTTMESTNADGAVSISHQFKYNTYIDAVEARSDDGNIKRLLIEDSDGNTVHDQSYNSSTVTVNVNLDSGYYAHAEADALSGHTVELAGHIIDNPPHVHPI